MLYTHTLMWLKSTVPDFRQFDDCERFELRARIQHVSYQHIVSSDWKLRSYGAEMASFLVVDLTRRQL